MPASGWSTCPATVTPPRPKAKVASWTALIHKFLHGRSNLARVYVLIDARHGLKEVDLDVLKTLDKSAVSYQVVLTKADQVKPAELEQRIADVEAALSKHPAAFPEVLVTSSRTGAGMPELRAAMVRLLGGAQLMMESRGLRILIILAGVMGADGVILAAASAHQPMRRGWRRLHRCCCFTPQPCLAAVALAERGIIHFRIGIAAACGFVIAAALFATDLTLAAICRPQPVPFCRADRRHASDRELARARGGGGMAAARVEADL